ncbi:hypothetical protein ELY21_14700 [Legionella sp. km535]|uniref:helix-turn-helix domain-containing protein n=1 Tax=Legionella sp. km535 TaxID=2498107 RepID=UPI000F8D165D|nr:S24 family peptidase [Legionella sp. km535]RUR15409.1 hypothetical protein ELY21_14700 [Legionella sp. km535]
MTTRILNRLSSALFQKDIEIDKYDTNTLSHRLKLCLKLYSLSQSELARLIGVKPQIIQYLCTKNVKSSRFTFELAEALDVDYTWLSTGEGAMRPTDAITDQEEHKIPLFDWSKLDCITNNELIESNSSYIYTSLSSSIHAFATKLDDISMEPRFEKGTTLIFDINSESHDGDFVLVKLNDANFWVFRELRINREAELLPVNTSIYKKLKLEPEDKIMGVLIQTICDFKRY